MSITSKIIVHYYREEPKVHVSDDLKDVEIQLIDDGEADQLVLDYNGIKIYKCLDDADASSENAFTSEYWMSTQPYSDAEFGSITFDIRDLPGDLGDELPKYMELFPGDDTKMVLAHAIDKGWITEDGYKQPPLFEK